MTVEELYNLSAEEIIGWWNFFQIYPFTQEREDYRIAMLCSVVAQGRIPLYKFLPDYDGSLKAYEEKSLSQQKSEALAFREKVLSLKGKHFR
jgi:hypothetical protein